MMQRTGLLSIAAITLSVNALSAENPKGINRDKYRINISKTTEHINVDGIMDEPVWMTTDVADKFQRVLPTDTGYAAAQTEVRVIYTESTLYMAIICYDKLPGKRPVESLRRDFAFGKNDNFLVFIDTYNDQTNGFSFGVSPAGAQWDGQQANGGNVNLNWDIKWRSAVKNYDDRWVAEFAIPFRSMRYNGGDAEWGINFSRQDLKTSEKSSWAPMPRQFATATLAFTGSLVWDEPLPDAGLRFSLIPYASAKTTQNKEAGEPFKTRLNAGGDAKMILSTSMNLDLTVNPDYSQVEVDRQRTNLDRFELFFPEKRQFFLENSDLFANLGTDNLRPFFSRRVGLTSPIQAGARLSGNIGNDWRIGLMDLQTGPNDDTPAGNYAVGVLQRKVFQRSNISAFMVNKEVMFFNDEDTTYTGNDFNRVAGAEFNLASSDNRWTGKTLYHQSFYPGADGDAAAAAANITFATQYFNATLNQAWVGADYNAEVGYIRRRGYYEVSPGLQYRFFPKASRIANHGPIFKTMMLFDPSMMLTDRESEISYQIEWLNKSMLKVDLENNYVYLTDPFDPTNSGGVPLPANTDYRWNELSATFTSDIRKPFNFMLMGLYGGIYNGDRYSLNSEIYYRVQPYAALALVSSYNNIKMPDPYNDAELILIGPRLDFTFTDKLFFTSLIQYNNQIDNMNINLRF
ncbi:MAG: carbohydrate binding family 9 domain-containing protein [Bacteroidetes bacterium]|nr:carbohydrate binding family 9 domain-containing protein [Bacteroidota bacterium]